MCDSTEALVVVPGFNILPLLHKVRTYNYGTYTLMLIHICYYLPRYLMLI
jgi:hypothetical protein